MSDPTGLSIVSLSLAGLSIGLSGWALYRTRTARLHELEALAELETAHVRVQQLARALEESRSRGNLAGPVQGQFMGLQGALREERQLWIDRASARVFNRRVRYSHARYEPHSDRIMASQNFATEEVKALRQASRQVLREAQRGLGMRGRGAREP